MYSKNFSWKRNHSELQDYRKEWRLAEIALEGGEALSHPSHLSMVWFSPRSLPLDNSLVFSNLLSLLRSLFPSFKSLLFSPPWIPRRKQDSISWDPTQTGLQTNTHFLQINSNLAEFLNPEIIQDILKSGRNPRVYWGTAVRTMRL